MTAELDIEVDHGEPGSPKVSVRGEVDLSNVDRLRGALDIDAPSLVVDLGGVTYIDSAGMAALFARAVRGRLEVHFGDDSVVGPLIDITRLCDVAVIRKY